MTSPCSTLPLQIQLYESYASERRTIISQMTDDLVDQDNLQRQLNQVTLQMGSLRDEIINTSGSTLREYYNFNGTWVEYMKHIGDME